VVDCLPAEERRRGENGGFRTSSTAEMRVCAVHVGGHL
jgi:hypothetical protein